MQHLFKFIPAADTMTTSKKKYYSWDKPRDDPKQVKNSLHMIKRHNQEMKKVCETVTLGKLGEDTPIPVSQPPATLESSPEDVTPTSSAISTS